ncbi:MAG: M20/M25/M40 family metallo-hydrolase, partial [Chloroflexota bacterium]
EGDFLYGRGAVDAKGPMATFVVAATRARPRNLRVTVIGAVEEEGASSRGARHVLQRPRPDFAIIGEPSGWTGITLGYKGRFWIDYSREQATAHSAGPGRSVAEEAIDFWNVLKADAAERNRGRKAFDAVDLWLRRLNTSGDGLAERVEMTVSVRVPLGLDVDAFKTRVREFAGEASCSFANEDSPYRAAKSTPLVRAFLGAIRETGGEPRFKLKTGTADMNVVGPVWNCPIVAYGPGDSTLDHTPNEHVSLGEYRRGIGVLVRVLESL